MPPWLSYTDFSIFFLVTGFLRIWAIREGVSFAFLNPILLEEGCRPRPTRIGRMGSANFEEVEVHPARTQAERVDARQVMLVASGT